MDMTLPFEPRPLHLEGIKHVAYLTPEEVRVEEPMRVGEKRGNYVEVPKIESQPRRSLGQRIRDYFLR